jgi:glycogen debranching enzyme
MNTQLIRALKLALPALLAASSIIQAQNQITPPPFPLTEKGLVISRPTQSQQPFTVAGPRGVLVGTQDGQFESWILPVKLLSHLTIEANVEGYAVPIPVNPQSANIEVRPDHTTITYSHAAFTLRQIMFSPDAPELPAGSRESAAPRTGPIVLFQIDALRPVDFVFRFTPEMRWMWPKRNDGIPGPDWVKFPWTPTSAPASATTSEVPPPAQGYYTLHMDYPDLAGAITIPTATPGIMAPYQERPQVHPLELRLHYDPKRDGTGQSARYFPLLMAVGTTRDTSTDAALGAALRSLNASIPEAYKAHAAAYEKLFAESTSIETPDKSLNEAFQWGVASIEQLKAHEYTSNQDALVAGYYSSADSARPGFGWFFGRDALYSLYAVNSFGDFALTRAELEFLIRRQREDGKIMHEYSQTAGDESVNWKQFGYMWAAADATPLFLMAMRDYLRASGDIAFVREHREAIEKAWAFETDPAHDTDHDGIYDNSQGTGWVESWPSDEGQSAMPHQEIYMAALDRQASEAYAALQQALGNATESATASTRAAKIQTTLESEYYDKEKGCYAFSHNPPTDPRGETDRTTTIYPAVAWWDDSPAPLAHPETCLANFASPLLDTDWGTRDVASNEPIYDGMSYHQGSVWPLFTGWAALAEYRANQPLAGEQLLMQNADLTWAQDPGAVTELLSGDFFVPFGRSTSHQLWSSAMVITPTLRGLFGISLDAATNTITVNPHLPANWDHAEVMNLHLGDESFVLGFKAERGFMKVSAIRESDLIHVPGTDIPSEKRDAKPLNIHFRSDVPDSKLSRDSKGVVYGISIPIAPVSVVIPKHELPAPGSRPSQIKVLSTKYGPKSLTVTVAGPADSESSLLLAPEQSLMKLHLDTKSKENGNVALSIAGPYHDPLYPEENMKLDLHFPPGQGWQTLEFTLTW